MHNQKVFRRLVSPTFPKPPTSQSKECAPSVPASTGPPALKTIFLLVAMVLWKSVSFLQITSVQEEPPYRQLSWRSQSFHPPTKGSLCNNYDGILFISQNHNGAGTGTFFFQAIVDQILFAEAHNLYPFIWMNHHLEEYNPCYDPLVHGDAVNATYTHQSGQIKCVRRYYSPSKCKNDPGPPRFPGRKKEREIKLLGNGIWHSYFEAYDIPFDDESCKDKPVFELSFEQVLPGLHYCWDDGIRGWPFKNLPTALKPEGQRKSVKEWLSDHRMRAAYAVHKYMKLQPWLQDKVEAINPAKNGTCLSVHIRMTDKANGRKKLGVESFLPYIEAFARQSPRTSDMIYLATDDARVIDDLLNISSVLTRSMFLTQPDVLQSTSKKATFDLFKNNKHRVNTETLMDIYSLSKCHYMVHGYSAVSEAAVYLNPSLDAHSVNVDDAAAPDAETFGSLVASTIHTFD